MGAAAIAAVGGLGLCASSARAQTQDPTLTQTTTLNGDAVQTGVIFNASAEVVDINQNGFNLTLTQGRLTKNGPFSSTIRGGRLFSGNGRFDFLVNDGTLTIDSALRLTQAAGQGGGLFIGGVGTLVLNSTSSSNVILGGINVIGGGTLRIADERNLGVREANTGLSNVTLDGGTLETIQKAVTFDPSRLLFVGTGGAQLRIGEQANLNLLADSQLRGSSPLTKSGVGTLVIGGDNFDSFSGRINVTAGDLELRNTRALSSRSIVSLAAGTGLDLRSDLATAAFNNDVVLPIRAPANAVMSIDVGSLGGKGGNRFYLGALSINGGSLDLSNSFNDGSILHFTGAANFISGSAVNVLGNASTWFDGPVGGTGGLTKTGGGDLYLAGDKDNTNTAQATVSGGTLRLFKNAPGLTAINGDVLINGGFVQFDQSNQVVDTSVFSLQKGGFRLNDRNEQFSALTNDGGLLTTGRGKLTLTGGGKFAPLPGGAVGAPLPVTPPGSLVLNSGTTTVDAGGLIDAFSVQVSGGVNTVQAGGVLSVGSGGLNFAGNLSPNVTLVADAATPGQLQLAGNVSFTGTAGTGSITNTGALPGTLDLKGASRTFTVGEGSAAVDLLVSAAVTNGSVNKSGAGVLRLEGTNAMTGLTINDGAVELASAGALGGTPVTVNAGTLRVRSDVGTTTFTSVLTVADATIDVDRDTPAGGTAPSTVEFGGLTIGANRLTVVGANNRGVRVTGPVTLNGIAVFDTAAPLTLSGVVGGAFGITKEGAGVATLDGAAANTFSGTARVQLGTLQLNKTAGNAVPNALLVLGGTARLLRPNQILDTGVVTVQGVGTLDVNGQTETIGTLSGAGGGTVNLGTGGVLTVTQGTFTGNVTGAGMLIQENPLGGTSAAVNLTGAQTFTGGVLVNHGSVTFSTFAPQHVGTTLNGGTWGVYNGSALNFGGSNSVNTSFANVTISGAASTFAKFDAVSNNQGSFTVTGGKSFTTAGPLTNAGTLTVGPASTLTFAGTFTNTGTTTATGALATTGAISTSGTLTVSGPQTYGPLSSLSVTGGTATLNTDAGATAPYTLGVTASGGNLAFTTTQHLRSLSVSAPVMLGAAAPAPLPAHGPAAAAVVAAGNQVLVTQSLSFSGSGKLDLTTNGLIFDYGGASGPALTTVRDAVVAAYAGGTWTGFGLTSSNAAASPGSYGIGFGEASAVFGISGTSTATFRGQTVDATAVVARFTPRGDATLDGIVNFDDLLVLAKNYNRTGVSYAQADFDFSGAVNFDDLLVLAKNYNTALGAAALPGAPAEFAADYALAMAQAPGAVPEPSAALLTVTAVIAGAAIRRRRRGPT